MTPEAIGDYIRSGYRYHIAVKDNVPIGVVEVRDNQHLYHLFVDEPYQRQGIARALWETAKQASIDAGGTGQFTVNSSRFAVDVYKRLGFIEASPPVEKDGVVFVPMSTMTILPQNRHV